ncbi:MAG: hypothetical protein WC528_03305 [Patescibacteria group bacterium]
MKKIEKIYQSLAKNWFWFSFVILAIIAFLVFSYFQYSATFADPDSFYHAKASLLIRDQGVSTHFPWLQDTVLRDSYTDQHFLYHIFLIPFVTFFDPLVGIKLATVFLGTILILVFYALLRRLQVRGAYLFSLILLLINPFTFRISLAKAPSVSLIFLILGLYFIFSRRPKWLFFISFLYVWFYGGFILIMAATLIYLFVGLVYDRWWKKNEPHRFLEKIFALLGRSHRFREKKRNNLKIFLAVLLGLIAGLVVNPYFPKNFGFYYHQLIKIGIINYSKIIGVGGEWYHYKFFDLITDTMSVSVILVIALILFFICIKRQSKISFTLFFIYILFFIFTLKSRRYVEYYVPFALLFASVSLRDSLAHLNFKKYLSAFKSAYFKNIWSKLFISLFILYLGIILPVIIVRDFKAQRRDLSNGIPFNKYYQVSQWLIGNSAAGTIVIHSDWDDFPVLFYHNSHNYYIVGLDPTFMYEYNKDLYWKWVDLTTGKEVPDLYEVVKNEFKASYLVIEKDHGGMYRFVSQTKNFGLVYEDNEVYLYQVN